MPENGPAGALGPEWMAQHIVGPRRVSTGPAGSIRTRPRWVPPRPDNFKRR